MTPQRPTPEELGFDPAVRLHKELEDTLRRDEAFQAHLTNQDGARIPEQTEDWVALLEDDEVLARLDVASRDKVAAIRRALVRIDKGTYGTSVVSGTPLSAERLQALPWADRTAAEAHARDGAQRRPRAPLDATRKAESLGAARASVDDDRPVTPR